MAVMHHTWGVTDLTRRTTAPHEMHLSLQSAPGAGVGVLSLEVTLIDWYGFRCGTVPGFGHPRLWYCVCLASARAELLPRRGFKGVHWPQGHIPDHGEHAGLCGVHTSAAPAAGAEARGRRHRPGCSGTLFASPHNITDMFAYVWAHCMAPANPCLPLHRTCTAPRLPLDLVSRFVAACSPGSGTYSSVWKKTAL